MVSIKYCYLQRDESDFNAMGIYQIYFAFESIGTQNNYPNQIQVTVNGYPVMSTSRFSIAY